MHLRPHLTNGSDLLGVDFYAPTRDKEAKGFSRRYLEDAFLKVQLHTHVMKVVDVGFDVAAYMGFQKR